MLIKDLSLELDTKALRAVRGGNNGNASNETIGQALAITVPVAIMNGGPSNNNVDVHGSQYATQHTFQLAGDSYLAWFPW